ncbi:MAG: uncharacterized protein QOG50_43 [Actinomycetota bacterium]|nr:uncharacterized protein [Actinomycetota bacterium]
MPRRRRSIGIRGWLIGVAILLVVLLLSGRGLARVYTDYLWFKEVGFSHTWRALIEAKLFPALIFAVLFFVLLFVDLIVADRLAPLARSTGPEDEIIERYRSIVDPYAGRIRFGVAVFFAIVMGSGVASEWRDWILFSNASKFGVKDPQFHKDIGFYVFRLPFLQFIASWTFAALLVVLIITAVFHYLNGGIRLQTPFQRVTPQVKVHISVILALMALTKTVQYYLSRFALTLSHRGTVDGATYTDVKAQLPALNLLMLISIAAAILFIANIFRKGWVFPIIAVGLWGFISIVVGTVYPAIIQRFVVQPNEFAREQTYIKRNIDATQKAFGLDQIHVQPFDYGTDVGKADVTASKDTLDNVRLWDPPEIKDAISATQEFQPYFKFSDVDIDRYDVNGVRVPALTGVRELDATNIPSSTWTNRHLVYTHGVGVDSARANSHAQDSPDYLLSDLPPTGALDLKQPDVYFGEGLSGYSVVDSKVQEQEVNGETSTVTTRYKGVGGVKVGGFARRLAFALRFGDFNLVYSGQVTSQSRILYLRDIKQRVQTAAPFLQWDHDPYPIVLNGRIIWMLDGYTTTNRYPYSQSINPTVPAGSGLGTDINYVRNSVKATVDSYDGTIHFYVVDPKDPIIHTYRKAFPDLFSDVKDMPAGLRDHWRYPEDLFDTQTEQYSQYHMTDPQQFFQKGALWDIAPNPDSGGTAAPAATSAAAGGGNGGRSTTLQSSGTPIDPLYLMMSLPGVSKEQEFVLERPFVPRSKANQLSSFMVARNDPAHYGQLVLYQMPPDSVAPSPSRAASLIEANPVISKQFSLLDQRGSSVIRGQAQLLPIGNSIFYVRPIFVQGQGSFPRWNYVAVTYGERAVLDTTSVADAIVHLLAATQPSVAPGGGTPTPTTTTTTTPTTQPTGGPTVSSLLLQAKQLFADANTALANQDLATFQADYKKAVTLVQQASGLAAGQTPPTTPSSSTSTSRPSSSSTSIPKTTTTVAHV